MPSIEKYSLGVIGTNAYLIIGEQQRAFIIDPGTPDPKLIKKIDELNKLEAILLTHAHFDHIGGVNVLRQKYGALVYLHSKEQSWLQNPMLNGSGNWPQSGSKIVTDPAEMELNEGQELDLCGQKINVMHTPGHSPGSVSFLMGDTLFSGDALFRRSIGRTDLPGGNPNQLYETIQKKLYLLSEHTRVLPGHGAQTTIGEEKYENPFVSVRPRFTE